MGKSPDAFRTISEVADWLGVQTHVLRFWESKFSQVKPLKRAGGRRYYRPADMELLGGIRKLLHDDGLTIKGAQKFIKENGVKAVAALSPSAEGPGPGAGAEAMAPMPGGTKEAEPDVAEAIPPHDTPPPALPEQPPLDLGPDAGPEAIRPIPGGSEVEPEAANAQNTGDVVIGDNVELGGDPTPPVDMTGEAPGPGVSVEIAATVDVSGEEEAGEFGSDVVDISADTPATPVHIDTIVDAGGEEADPAVGVHLERTIDVSSEDEAAAFGSPTVDMSTEEPEVPVRLGTSVDVSAEEEPEVRVPSFISKAKARETTVPPVFPGPPPLPEGTANVAGVGDPHTPPTPDAAAANTPAPPEPMDFDRVPVDASAPLPQRLAALRPGSVDKARIQPLYARLTALRERMG